MKKSILIMLLGLAIISCNNPKEKDADTAIEDTETSSSISSFQGEFIYSPDAAVLKGNNFIYGVLKNDMAEELASRVEEVKAEEYDMVPVIVKGELNPKPEGTEGWDQILTITEIVHVSAEPTVADIELKQK